MVCYASLRPALFAHLRVRSTSHPHSKDVNISEGMHSETNEHSEIDHKITNPDTRMMNLEMEVKELKTDFKDFKAEMKDFKAEMKDFRKDVLRRFDTLSNAFQSNRKEMALTFQSSQKEMALTFQSALKEFAHDQQKQFAYFYARSFFGVSLALPICIQASNTIEDFRHRGVVNR